MNRTLAFGVALYRLLLGAFNKSRKTATVFFYVDVIARLLVSTQVRPDVMRVWLVPFAC